MLKHGSVLVSSATQPILNNIGAGIGGGLGAALGSIIGTDIEYRLTQPGYLRSLTEDQRARYQRHRANTQTLSELDNQTYATQRDYNRARRRLRKERPEVFEKIDLSDLPERPAWSGHLASLAGAGLGALALGYAGHKLQNGLKQASDEEDEDLDSYEEERASPVRNFGRGLLALLAGGTAGIGTQAVAGGALMSELGSNANPGEWNLRQRGQWSADKRMAANWLRRKGITPNIVDGNCSGILFPP